MNEGGREEPPPVRLRFQDALHPVVVLRLLGEDDDDVTLLEGELVLVVRLTVVQRPAPLIPLQVNPLKRKGDLI